MKPAIFPKQTRILFTRIVEAFFKNYGKISVGIPVGKAVNLQNQFQQLIFVSF